MFKFEDFTVNHKLPLIEKWQDYTINPPGDNKPKDNYQYIDSGFDPIYLYKRDRYTRPYRSPLTFLKSYPVQHKTFFP